MDRHRLQKENEKLKNQVASLQQGTVSLSARTSSYIVGRTMLQRCYVSNCFQDASLSVSHHFFFFNLARNCSSKCFEIMFDSYVSDDCNVNSFKVCFCASVLNVKPQLTHSYCPRMHTFCDVVLRVTEKHFDVLFFSSFLARCWSLPLAVKNADVLAPPRSSN